MPSNNLKKLRKDKKLTLTALSERSGVSIAQIWNIENKPGTPRKATMDAIAKGLGCRVSTVFPDTKVTPSAGLAKDLNLPKLDAYAKAINMIADRSPSELGRIVTMLEAAFPR
jgi:transcriptional regulator with XRE-family HTH domain